MFIFWNRSIYRKIQEIKESRRDVNEIPVQVILKIDTENSDNGAFQNRNQVNPVPRLPHIFLCEYHGLE